MQRSKSLFTVLALVVGVGTFACSEDEPASGAGGAGGAKSGGAGGAKTGGAGGTSTGGSPGTGGSSGAGGSSTGGAGGAAKGGSGGAKTDGAAGSGGAKGDAGDAKPGSGGSSGDGGGASAFSITIDHIPHPTKPGRLCFKKESTNSGGDQSPKIDWTAPPAGTKSLVLTVYDQSNMTPHQIICNITPDVMGRAADQKAMIPTGAQSSTGHNKPNNSWYGPGAGGAAHAYEIRIWALSTPMLEGGCGASGAGPTRAVYMKLKNAPATLVLASDGKVLNGNREGSCD